MKNYNLNFNADRQSELETFVSDEGGEKVEARIQKIQNALKNEGINLGTRTTDAALLALVHGFEVEEEDEEEDSSDLYYFANEVKPQQVQERIQKVKNLLAQSGINQTRTTLAALRLISDSFKL